MALCQKPGTLFLEPKHSRRQNVLCQDALYLNPGMVLEQPLLVVPFAAGQ